MNPSPLYRSRQYQNIDANKGGYSTVVPSRRLRASSVDPRRPIPLPPRRNVVTSQSVYTNPSLPRQQLYYPQLKPPLQPTHKSTPVRTSTKPQTLYTVYSTDRLLSTQNSHNNCSYGPARYRMAAERSSYGHEKEWLPRSSSVTKFSSSSFPVGETYGSRLSRDSRSHDQQSWSPKKFAYNDLPKHVSYLTLYDNGPSDAVAGSRTPTYHAQQRHSRPREDSPESRRRSQSSFYRSPSPTNANNISVASSYDQTSSDARVGHVLSSSAGLVGLSNLGNTCFMNSVLQCLSHTWELLRVCLDRTYQSELNVNSTMKGSLFVAYADLMRQMWTPSNSTTAAATPTTSSSSSSISAFPSYVTPQNFRAKIQRFAPRFMGYAQQDAQEFLRYLVQGLHEDVNRVTKRPPSEIPNYDEEDRMPDSKKAILYWNRYKRIDDSLIADIFLGQLMSTLECMSCGHKSTTFDPFWDLSLPIPRGTDVNILNCFDLFTSNEVLDGAEQPVHRPASSALPTCSGCKRRQPCRKRFSIQRFPTVLVIHLKRFSGERSRSKLTTFINYPIERLDLTEYASHCSSETNAHYRLYGVSNHSGSVFGGHYTACCLHPKLNSWFEYNDTRVRPIQTREAVSSEAYVLFYQRIDGRSA